MSEVRTAITEDKAQERRQLVVRDWLRRAMLDYFVAFRLEDLVNYRLFPLHQGIEKLCKAYLLAKNSGNYASLESEEAMTLWIEDFVKKCGHDLCVLVGQVAQSFGGVKEYVIDAPDQSFLHLLTMAYQESRYPKPIGQSIWDKHGLPALVSHRNEEQAYALGSTILCEVERRFGISYPLDSPIDSGIAPDNWRLFLNIWNLRKGREVGTGGG